MQPHGLEYLFVFPDQIVPWRTLGFGYHLGTAFIRSFLSAHGVYTEQFVHSGNATIDELAGLIVERDARIVGFSCYDSNYYIIKLLAERIRTFSPGILIICGGPTATFSDHVIMRDCSAVDLCVRAYGEIACLDLFHWMHGTLPIESIPGITYRKKGHPNRTRDRTFVENFGPMKQEPRRARVSEESHRNSLDVFPDPYIFTALPPTSVTELGVITSRGCTFPCTYCNFSAMSRRTISFHSEDRVIDVLRFLDDNLSGVNGQECVVPIVDDNFSLNTARLHRLLERMIREGFRSLKFEAQMRTESLTDESFALLRDAGFTMLNFGLESAVPEVLARVRKVRAQDHGADGYEKERLFLKRIAWAVDAAKKVGLETSVSVILGLPGESEPEGRATLDFIRTLDVDFYWHNLLGVRSGTELDKNCELFGIKVIPSPKKTFPRTTIHAFDTRRLPVMENGRYPSITNDMGMFHVLRLFTGTDDSGDAQKMELRTNVARFHQQSVRGTKSEIPLMAFSSAVLTDTLMDWLVQEVPVWAWLWVLYEDSEVFERGQSRLQRIDRTVQGFNNLRKKTNGSHRVQWRENELSLTAPAENGRNLYELPFGDADEDTLSNIGRQPRSAVLMTLTTKKDINSLLRFVESGEKDGIWRFSANYVNTKVALVDECRWGGVLCPATKGARWFVDKEETITTCLHGRCIGRIGDSFETLRHRVLALKEDQAKSRGCNSCPVNRHCSGCLFPYPLSDDEFCSIRRRFTDLSTVVDSLALSRGLNHGRLAFKTTLGLTIRSMRSAREEAVEHRGEKISLNEFLLLELEASGVNVLYHGRRDLLVKLSKVQARIYKMLSQEEPE